MKFIGQFIQDLIARFRSDVYLEDLTESAQDHVVGIDGDGKLYKQDVFVGDITGVTAGNALTGGGTSGTVTVNHEDTSSQASVNNSGSAVIQDVTLDTYGHVTGLTSATLDLGDSLTYNGSTANGLLTYGGASTIDVESTFTFNGSAGNLVISSSTESQPSINLLNTNTDANGPIFNFDKTSVGADNDELGQIGWVGEDEGGGSHTFAQIIGTIKDATPTQEAGLLEFKVAEYDGTVTTGLKLDGDTDADGEVDVVISAGAGSTTTIAGDLTVTSKATIPTRKLSVTAGSSAGEYDGDVVYTGTTTTVAGDLYVYNSSGTWAQTSASNEVTTKGLLAVALGTASDTDGMLLRGMVTTGSIAGTQDEGAAVYIRATTGDMTCSAPTTSGQFVRVVGYCMENSNNRIYFNPDNTYIEIA